MQLQPREYFTIVRQLPDPSDSATYYVRAVVRNARTDTVIDTVSLADRGSRRFTMPYQVPADTSGLGFYISVCTTVYTDSSYTTKSDSYAEEMQTYLIDDRFRNLGGGGGSDVDYKKIRKIFSEVLSGFAWGDLFNITPVLAAIKGLGLSKLGQWISVSNEKLTSIEGKLDGIGEDVKAIEPAEPTDLSPVLQAIADKEVTELPDPISLEPVLEAIAELHSALNTTDIQNVISALPEVSKNAKELEDKIKDLVFVIGKQSPAMEQQLKDFFYGLQTHGGIKPKESEKPKVDYSKTAQELVNLGK